MNKRNINENNFDTSSSRRQDRELEIQDWNRERGIQLAQQEKIEMTDAHWQVIDFLRQRYVEKGEAESARDVAEELDELFAAQGGDRYLRKLFPGGPVSQGSRIAGLSVPAYSQDPSFGTTY
jgi:tRNA 2-thiouridine synthesizing protein E